MTSRKEKPIIEVKHLSKEYQIGMDRTYKRFTESFTSAVQHPIRTLRGLTEPKDTFWALKDINFEVERGEVLGIIGRNGAGKSTLLKILSRITYPTEGEIVMRGRVGSLLEVGTGFHPELTGRENIFFNGAILGMKKREIEEKFDEIVKFSGVEKFLDTPVKRYSSGMQVRLAFSVAAHLDPEILLVDEVLAVGDAEFQKKCLGKMGEVASEGRTVLFVSHNMEAIQTLCQKGIYLNKGGVIGYGEVSEEIGNYLKSHSNRAHINPDEPIDIGTKLRLEQFKIEPNPLISGEKVHFSMTIHSKCKVNVDSMVLLLYSPQEIRVAIIDLRLEGKYRFNEHSKKQITGTIQSLPLIPNTYHIGLYYNYEGEEGNIYDMFALDIYSNESNMVVPYSPNVRGLIKLNVEFNVVE